MQFKNQNKIKWSKIYLILVPPVVYLACLLSFLVFFFPPKYSILCIMIQTLLFPVYVNTTQRTTWRTFQKLFRCLFTAISYSSMGVHFIYSTVGKKSRLLSKISSTFKSREKSKMNSLFTDHSASGLASQASCVLAINPLLLFHSRIILKKIPDIILLHLDIFQSNSVV